MGSHVINDQVTNDINTGSIASSDHVGKLLAISGPRLQLVRDRLVTGPPLRTLDVLIRW